MHRYIALARNWVSSLLTPPEEKYLAESVDHCDLEQRLQRLQRAPQSHFALWATWRH